MSQGVGFYLDADALCPTEFQRIQVQGGCPCARTITKLPWEQKHKQKV